MPRKIDMKQADKSWITPETKVAALLEEYPELEPVLIEMTPAFTKLRNPVLRKTVARVCTLRQAANMGGVPLGTMIETLHKAAGISTSEITGEAVEAGAETSQPDWVSSRIVVKTLDARPLLQAGEHPVNRVLGDLRELRKGQLYELVTPFLPAPLIDMAKQKGYQAWSKEEGPAMHRTFFTLP
jgi:uncharacterized protein (DUF2249 family)